ncbi:MAG: GNAT family N-acetyltransferase [Phycisphaerae bacterium]|nr:GNAT family N-acetyltransferase [Phycisphaerae bacterium]
MKYLTVENVERRVVFDLLCQGFEPLMNDELRAKLKRYDEEIFNNSKTVGACVFLTQFDGKLIGMASWDPRNFPKAIVGYNCIIPEFQSIGFGELQLCELVNRLALGGFTEVSVTTGDHPFYVPSQKMYESCGFVEIQRDIKSNDPRYGSIEYQLIF